MTVGSVNSPSELATALALSREALLSQRWDEVEVSSSLALRLMADDHPERWKALYRRGAARRERGDLDGAENDLTLSVTTGAGRSVARELDDLRRRQSPASSSGTLPSTSSSPSTSFTSEISDIAPHLALRKSALGQLGLFATTHLPCGKLLIDEHALVTSPAITAVPDVIERLSTSSKTTFYSLANSFPSTGPTARSVEKGIWETNSYELASPLGSTGIYPKCARFNHSCTPNAMASLHPLTGTVRVHVIKPDGFAAGDEVLTSYLAPKVLFGSSRASRRNTLEEGWSFVCGCEACGKQDDEGGIESDRRRLRIAALRESIPRLKPADGEAEEVLEKVGRAIKLLAEEELGGLKDSFATAAANVCAYHGDYRSSARWTQLAHISSCDAYGADAPHSRLIEDFLEDPRKYLFAGKGAPVHLGTVTDTKLACLDGQDPPVVKSWSLGVDVLGLVGLR